MQERERRLRRVCKILLEVWDPIGVADEPAAQDEYDSYAAGVLELVVERAPESAVAEHLLKIEREWMALAGDVVRAKRAARALLQVGHWELL